METLSSYSILLVIFGIVGSLVIGIIAGLWNWRVTKFLKGAMSLILCALVLASMWTIFWLALGAFSRAAVSAFYLGWGK